MLYRTWGKVGEERRKREEEGRRGRRGNERWRGGKGRREKRRRRRGGVRMKGKGRRERVRIEEGKGDMHIFATHQCHAFGRDVPLKLSIKLPTPQPKQDSSYFCSSMEPAVTGSYGGILLATIMPSSWIPVLLALDSGLVPEKLL